MTRLSRELRISTGASLVQISHQWRLVLSRRLRVPHLSQTNITVLGFLTGRTCLTQSVSDHWQEENAGHAN